MFNSKDATSKHQKEIWKSLQLYAVYRFILAATLVILSFQYKFNPLLYQLENSLAYGDAVFLTKICWFYLAFAIITLGLSLTQLTSHRIQTHVTLSCDIVFLIIIMHASGGILSGMGLLLIIVAAAYSILSPGKLSYFVAAIISLGLFAELLYSLGPVENLYVTLNQTGLLGLTIFATSVITNFLSQRAYKNQSIIVTQAKQLANSYQLNAVIIDLMQQGVVVLDSDDNIQMINKAAFRLLQLTNKTKPNQLQQLPQTFQHCVYAWGLHKENLSPVQINPMAPKVRLEFQCLGEQSDLDLIVFLYDVQAETRKAQDLKLSSLGHLTANIAHELRNPLGAASHAAQLLMESEHLKEEELTLAKMIQNHCERMNQVIKNVLSISCQKTNLVRINLNQWLSENIPHIKFSQYPDAFINFKPSKTIEPIEVDPSQLMQIIVNLCENGLRYSLKKTGKAQITLQTHFSDKTKQISLDIIDQGDGIAPEQQEFIFEPFFTTEKQGTGLGLYLAKELSHINGADLDYQKSHIGSQFRITFSQENKS